MVAIPEFAYITGAALLCSEMGPMVCPPGNHSPGGADTFLRESRRFARPEKNWDRSRASERVGYILGRSLIIVHVDTGRPAITAGRAIVAGGDFALQELLVLSIDAAGQSPQRGARDGADSAVSPEDAVLSLL